MAHIDKNQLAERLLTLSAELRALSDEVTQDTSAMMQQSEGQPIDDLSQFGLQLNARRKALGIDLAMLELQTGISVSTLKRLFKDPAQVKFGTVMAVAQALGVKLCSGV